jgi:hypothetical protein
LKSLTVACLHSLAYILQKYYESTNLLATHPLACLNSHIPRNPPPAHPLQAGGVPSPPPLIASHQAHLCPRSQQLRVRCDRKAHYSICMTPQEGYTLCSWHDQVSAACTGCCCSAREPF